MKRLALLIPLLVYLALAMYQLDLPGLHYDEAFEVVPAMQLLHNQPTTPFRDSAIILFGKQFPLTTQDYIGALNTYAAIPFIGALGSTTFSLRLYSILVGLLTLLLVYGFCNYVSQNSVAGLVAVAWLAVTPTFVFWSRQGVFVTAITALIGVGAAWSWLAWWRSGRYRFALLGAFLFGLGLYAKLLFVWLIGALVGLAALVILARRRPPIQVWQRINLSSKQIIGLPLAGAFGCWPLILYNVQTGGTFKSITENAGVSYYGVNNADVWTNLGTRFEQLGILLSGGHLWYLGDVYANSFAVGIFLLAIVASIWLVFPRRTEKIREVHEGRYGETAVSGQPSAVVLLPYLLIILVLLQSIVTVSALWVTHFAVIMVWPAIALAVTWIAVFHRFQGQRPVKLTLILLLALLLITDLTNTVRYHAALTTTGGLGTHSDAVYDLTDWLAANNNVPMIAMDWGLAAPVIYLTEGKANVVEVFGYGWQTDDRFDEIIQPYLAPEAAIYLWRAPDEIIFDRSTDFKARYQPLNLEETILEAFYERSGRPIMGATQLVPVGSAENKPVETQD